MAIAVTVETASDHYRDITYLPLCSPHDDKAGPIPTGPAARFSTTEPSPVVLHGDRTNPVATT
jgi:hypothetical protein